MVLAEEDKRFRAVSSNPVETWHCLFKKNISQFAHLLTGFSLLNIFKMERLGLNTVVEDLLFLRVLFDLINQGYSPRTTTRVHLNWEAG